MHYSDGGSSLNLPDIEAKAEYDELTYHPSIETGKPAEKPKHINPNLLAARAKSKLGSRRKQIMSEVFFALERRGGSVEGNEDSAAVQIDNQRLTFRVVEKLRQVKLPLSELDKRWKTASFKRGHNVGLEPSGLLRFEIETYLRGQVKQVWQEDDGKSLENFIQEFVHALIEGAQVRQEWDNAWQAEQEAKEQAAARRQKAASDAALDNARWEMLVSLATARNEAQLVSSYVASFIANDSVDRDTQVGDRSLGDWLDWLDIKLEQRGGPRSPAELFRKLHALEHHGHH